MALRIMLAVTWYLASAARVNALVFGHDALDRLLVQGPWAAHLEAARLRASRRQSLDLARDGALVAAQETRDVSATLAFRPPLLQETPLFFGHVGVARIPGHVK